jgi:ferritin-like metal-binding protein YciE
MPTSNLQEQLIKYLTDAHSIEEQALVQMKMAPKIAGEDHIATVFADHLSQTEEHERLVAQRLQDLDASPSKLKDVAGRLTGQGFGVFAMLQPDTPGKLVAHAFSYEHMEEAAYEMLVIIAQRTGDDDTVSLAQRIGEQEGAMGQRLAGCFDLAVHASLAQKDPDDLQEQVNKYLSDAHAIEGQAIQLLERGPALAGLPELATAYEEHRGESQRHQQLVAQRLQARGGKPSRLKEAGLRLGALNWAGFFAAQPDTAAKLAAFAYAYEHLEIAAYELLARVASRAGDHETVRVAEGILSEENAAAQRIRSLFGEAMDSTLHERGLAPH